jgi:hypothetical protein
LLFTASLPLFVSILYFFAFFPTFIDVCGLHLLSGTVSFVFFSRSGPVRDPCEQPRAARVPFIPPSFHISLIFVVSPAAFKH